MQAMQPAAPSPAKGGFRKPARITYLKVENFRALHWVEFKDLAPLMNARDRYHTVMFAPVTNAATGG
jgi:hypothetical protein